MDLAVSPGRSADYQEHSAECPESSGGACWSWADPVASSSSDVPVSCLRPATVDVAHCGSGVRCLADSTAVLRWAGLNPD